MRFWKRTAGSPTSRASVNGAEYQKPLFDSSGLPAMAARTDSMRWSGERAMVLSGYFVVACSESGKMLGLPAWLPPRSPALSPRRTRPLFDGPDDPAVVIFLPQQEALAGVAAVAHLRDDFFARGGFGDEARFLDRVRERFLDVGMFAEVHRCQGGRCVVMIRG